MNAPLLWIGLPAAVAVVLWFLQRRERMVISIAVGVCLFLTLLAWQVPIGKPLNLGPLNFEFNASLQILGRRLVINPSDRYYLMLIYGVGAVWFFGARIAGTRRIFIPVGLLFLALMVAAQTVEPFLYAALLIEIGILLSLPILKTGEGGDIQGIQRYLVFQMMGLPFILLAGWASGLVELNPSASPLLSQATLLIAMGFAFWLGIFPFNTWIPTLTSQTHPYVSSFILAILLSEINFLVVFFLDGFSWLRTNPLLPVLFQVSGVATVVTAGIWAAFQRDLLRLMGYGVILESGFTLLSLSLAKPLNVNLFAISLVPRLVGFSIWGLALSIFKNHHLPLTFEGVAGSIKRFPFAALALIIAYFSTAGLPLMAGFPVRQVLLENLAQSSPVTAIWVFIGSLGFIAGGVRMFMSMIGGEETRFKVEEKRLEIVLLLVGVVVLLMIGLFPNIFLPVWMNLAEVFERLR